MNVLYFNKNILTLKKITKKNINNQINIIINPQNIRILDFSNLEDKTITELPNLDKFYNLQELYCNNNNLHYLPSLNNLHNLTTLNCNNNCLTKLPSLLNCKKLNDLNCSNNSLTKLPNLKNCKKLENLNCYNNLITKLPKSIIYCNKLCFVKNKCWYRGSVYEIEKSFRNGCNPLQKYNKKYIICDLKHINSYIIKNMIKYYYYLNYIKYFETNLKNYKKL